MTEKLQSSWNQFWFANASVRSLSALRIAVCAVAAVWFASFLPQSHIWFGESGLLSFQLSMQIVEFEELSRWQLWSPLWLTQSLLLVRLWLILGIVLAVLGATGIGGRITMSALTIWAIAWIHRLLWLTGPIEPALVPMLAYLIVEPGANLLRKEQQQRVTQTQQANIALRLFQTHWWLLLAAGTLSQLASFIWWQGDAAWWLAASGRSNLLSPGLLSGSPWLVNLITHGLVACQLLTLWLITIRPARNLGIALGVCSCLGIGLISDQLLYAFLLSAVLIAYIDPGKDTR